MILPRFCLGVALAVILTAAPRSLAEATSYEELFMGLPAPLSEKTPVPKARNTPDGTVTALYANPVFFNLRNSFPKGATLGLEGCFTPSLVRYMGKCSDDIGRWMAKYRGIVRKLPMGEGSIFLSCYEGGTSFEVGKPMVKKDTARVPVMLTYVEPTSSYKWTDTAVLKLIDGAWRLDDIDYGDGRTLRKRISIGPEISW